MTHFTEAVSLLKNTSPRSEVRDVARASVHAILALVEVTAASNLTNLVPLAVKEKDKIVIQRVGGGEASDQRDRGDAAEDAQASILRAITQLSGSLYESLGYGDVIDKLQRIVIDNPVGEELAE